MLKDKRCFTRYELQYEFALPVQGKAYQALLFDYSFDGLRLGLSGVPPLRLGDVMVIDFPAYKRLGGQCKVVWLRRQTDGRLMVGLHKEGVLQGSLKHYNFADVLMGLQRRNKTGSVAITSGPIQKTVFLEGSDIVHAVSNAPADRLSDMLLNQGRITKPQYIKAMDLAQRSGKKLPQILVDMMALLPDEARVAMFANVESILAGLFELNDADFYYRDGNVPMGKPEGLNLQIGYITRMGIQRITDIARLKALCPPPESVPIYSTEPLNLFQDLRLGDNEASVLGLIDGSNTLEHIAQAAPVGELYAYQTIYALLCTRTLDVIEAGMPALRRYTPTLDDVMTGQPSETDPEKFMHELEFMSESFESLGYYGVLGIAHEASPEEVERAYYMKAKAFHPDRHFYLPEGTKRKLIAIFNFINTAYDNLINPDLRQQYDCKEASVTVCTDKVYKAKELFASGTEAWKKSRLVQAADFFKEAALLNDTVAKYHYSASVALSRIGRQKEAERAIQRAIALEPSNADYQAEAGYIYVALGFQLRAKACFDRALKIQPLHVRAVQGMNLIKQ